MAPPAEHPARAASSKRYPDGTVAVARADLDVPAGELVCLVGPSGCGKTTTMKMVNRLIEPTTGRILLDGEDVTTVDPVELRRRMGYVIQQVGLFPHLTSGPTSRPCRRLLGWDKRRQHGAGRRAARARRARPGDVRQALPAQLSGGQRQRVGVARALAADPPVLLMDEPFCAIDPIARDRLQAEFLRVQAEVRKTIVFVTHDIDEAVRLGDRIAVFRQGGHLEQYDTPAQRARRARPPTSSPTSSAPTAGCGGWRSPRSPPADLETAAGGPRSTDTASARGRCPAMGDGPRWAVVLTTPAACTAGSAPGSSPRPGGQRRCRRAGRRFDAWVPLVRAAQGRASP